MLHCSRILGLPGLAGVVDTVVVGGRGTAMEFEDGLNGVEVLGHQSVLQVLLLLLDCVVLRHRQRRHRRELRLVEEVAHH